MLTYAATVVAGLAAQHTGRPNLIRSPKQMLAHTWEGRLAGGCVWMWMCVYNARWLC